MNQETKSGALRTTEVDGFVFEFYQISPRELLSLLWKATALLGMSLKGAAGAQQIDFKTLDTNAIVGSLCEKLDEKTFSEISDRLLAKCTVQAPEGTVGLKGGPLSQRATYDMAFGGDGGLMRFFSVMAEAVGCYYGGFFADLSAKFGLSKVSPADLLKKAMKGSTAGSGAQSSPAS